MKYEDLRKEYLEKLENTQNVLTELPKFEKYQLFQNSELEQLGLIKDKNSLYLDKLKKGEIEVAIVGMENTGKSTFANALIKLKEAFPTGSIRTTYTSTRLKYGSEDKAIVEFFSNEEFNSMFREMLKKVKFPDYEKESFERISADNYERYFNNLQDLDEPLYKFHYATTHEDIKNILIGKSEIIQYLNHPIKTFSKTQISNHELKKFITDKYIARTVKKVELELSEFADTKEMVLYDVPGFNSTTEKHKIETQKSLNSADAIILIKNVIANSQITSEEKSMLNRYDETTGIKLSDKLFVYGTQVDKANTQEEARLNIETLNSDLTTSLQVQKNRIFVGSPYAYMQSLKLEDGNNSVERLTEWGMSDSIDSVEKMKSSIKEFYKNEAFENIKSQINKNIAALKNILYKIVIDNDEHSLLENLLITDNKKIINFTDSVKIELKSKLLKLKYTINQDISENEYFSKSLQEQVDTIKTDVTIEELEEINLSQTDIRGEFATNKVNTKYREILKPEILSSFENLIVNIANDKAKQYQNETIDILLNILEVDDTNIYKNEIKENLAVMLRDLTYKISYSQTSYVYLIQRFTRDLVSVVIGAEKGSTTRKDRFKRAKKEFVSLAMYYEDIVNIENIYDLKLIQEVLNLSTGEKVVEDSLVRKTLESKYESYLEYQEFQNVIDTLENKGLNEEKSIEVLEDVLANFKNVSSGNIGIVEKKVYKKLESLNEEEKKIVSKDSDEIETLFEKIEVSQTKEELLQELNSDIAVLKDILKLAVIKAINLELPFITSFADQNEKIINSNSEFNDFISKYYNKIKYQELEESQEQKRTLEEKKEAIINIRALQSKI